MKYQFICHKDDEEREDHKYVARVLIKKGTGKKKNTYRYFYDKEQYQAYLNSKKVDKNEKSKKKDKSSKLDELFSKVDKLADKIDSKVDNAGKKLVDDLFSSSKKSNESKASKAISEAKKKVNSVLNNIGDKTLNSLNTNIFKGKKKVKEVIGEIKNEVSDTAKSITKAVNAVSDVVAGGIVKTAVKEIASKIIDTLKPQEQVEDLKKLKRKDKKYSKDEDQAAINPKYDSNAPHEAEKAYSEGDEEAYYEYCEENYEYNCSYCTAAYDLRQRGYDVEAMPINMLEDDNPTNEEVMSWYKDAKLVDGSDAMKMSYEEKSNISFAVGTLSDENIDNFVDSLEEHEDGSYGHMFLYWTGGGGHDVVWSIENGEAVIRDCQTNTTYEPEELLSRCAYAEYFRSDNLELSDEITRVVRNRK